MPCFVCGQRDTGAGPLIGEKDFMLLSGYEPFQLCARDEDVPGLATDADVTAGNGPADCLMAYPDEGGSFVDLEGEPRRVCGGIDEVGWCGHGLDVLR